LSGSVPTVETVAFDMPALGLLRLSLMLFDPCPMDKRMLVKRLCHLIPRHHQISPYIVKTRLTQRKVIEIA